MRTHLYRALMLGLALGFFGVACTPTSPQVPQVAVDEQVQGGQEVEEPAPVEPEPSQPVAEEPVPPAAPEQPAPNHAIKVLSVPFTVQAPYANWDMPYQEACEEASIIMVAEYVSGNKSMRIPADEADQKILELVEWEGRHGYSVDVTAQEVARILGERFEIKAKAVPYDAGVIRQEIQAKQPVIIPAAGRLLGNPYFTSPGPLYHMLVIKGYEGEEFITNDPGTKRGESYRYHESVLGDVVHDWNGGDVVNGAQMMVVLEP